MTHPLHTRHARRFAMLPHACARVSPNPGETRGFLLGCKVSSVAIRIVYTIDCTMADFLTVHAGYYYALSYPVIAGYTPHNVIICGRRGMAHLLTVGEATFQ